MSDNTLASGGDIIRTFDDATQKWETTVAAYITGGSAGAWTVQYVDATHGLPVNLVAGTLTTVTTVTTVSTVTNLAKFGGQAIDLGNGATGVGTLRVTMANDSTGILAGVTTVSTVTSLSQFAGSAINLGNGTAGTGTLRVTLASDSTGSINVGTITTVTTLTGSGVASGSVDSGNPHKIGAVAHTAAPTAVTDGQRVNLIADKVGKLVTVGSIRDLKGKQKTQISGSTAETTIVTAVASTFLDLYGLIITNTSATVCAVTIRDDTAGTILCVIEVPATDTRGFMLTDSSAIPQAVVNKPWTAQCGTSVAAIEITALYVKNL